MLLIQKISCCFSDFYQLYLAFRLFCSSTIYGLYGSKKPYLYLPPPASAQRYLVAAESYIG